MSQNTPGTSVYHDTAHGTVLVPPVASRPILFSAPMVRALLKGRKTQTRRVLKPQPEPFRLKDGALCDVYLLHTEGDKYPRIALGDGRCGVITNQKVRCAVGDRLLVREAVAAYEQEDGLDGVTYRADGAFLPIENTQAAGDRWVTLFTYRGRRGAIVPPIHMPRWASRLTLVVTDVRVQRLQDISEKDAKAEGIHLTAAGAWSAVENYHPLAGTSPIGGFYCLWESINGPGSWDANPFVAAYTFTVHHCNIDAMPAPTAAAAE